MSKSFSPGCLHLFSSKLNIFTIIHNLFAACSYFYDKLLAIKTGKVEKLFLERRCYPFGDRLGRNHYAEEVLCPGLIDGVSRY